MKHIKLYENFHNVASISEIYLSNISLLDIVKKYKLKDWEYEKIKQIFDNRIPYFKSNSKSNNEFVNKFINPEDSEEVYDTIHDVKNMDFLDYVEYNNRNYQNIIPHINYFIAHPLITHNKKGDIISKNFDILMKEIKDLLENPISSDKKIYAVKND